jgi:hypothetical protein
MSISIWNKHKNIDSAISVLWKGLRINSSREIKAKLNSDLNELIEIKKEKENAGKPISSAPNISTTSGIGTTIYHDTVYFVLFHMAIIFLGN